MVEAPEAQAVLYDQPAVFEGEFDRLVSLLDRPHARVGSAVGVVERVHAEVGVIGIIPEIPAVCPVRFAVLGVHFHAVVDPFPDAAADQPGIGVYGVPVLGQAARAQAHGVAVLAHEVGARFVFALALAYDFLHRGVHGGDHVGGAVALPVALVMHGAGGVQRLYAGIHLIVIAAVVALVAQGPEYDGGMVVIPLDHAVRPVDILLFPFGRVGKMEGYALVARGPAPVHGAVALKVCLVHHVQAVLVAQLQPAGVVGIVAGAHAVHVHLLHQLHVPDQGRYGGHVAQAVMGVVAVHAL